MAGRCLLLETEGITPDFRPVCPFSSVTSSMVQTQNAHKNILYRKKKRKREEEKDPGRENIETAYPMENFKDQVSFQCSFVYFSSDFVLFSPFQSEGAGQRSQ